MRSCPQCKQTFDDDNDFCPNDGARLETSAYFTPTQVISRHDTQSTPSPTSSPWLYLVIGCLATALVGVGLYAFVGRDSGDTAVANSSPSPTAVDGAAKAPTTPTPTATAVPAPPSSADSADPRGRWSGDWSTASGAYYAWQMNLDSDEGDGLTGQIVWTLRRTPRPDKQSKVGMSATEYITGRYDPAGRVVRLKGHSKNDPGGLLVMLDEYRLNLSSDGRRLAGQARNGGKWNGIVNLSK